MKEYGVIIEETVSKEFKVTAESEEAALETARELYRSAELILEPGDITARKIAVLPTDGADAEWTEL